MSVTLCLDHSLGTGVIGEEWSTGDLDWCLLEVPRKSLVEGPGLFTTIKRSVRTSVEPFFDVSICFCLPLEPLTCVRIKELIG